MSKDRFLFEHMIRAETKQHVCRMWREMVSATDISNEELKNRAVSLMTEYYTVGFIDGVAGVLVGIPGVNSVEIIDRRTGDGCCVHKNWP